MRCGMARTVRGVGGAAASSKAVALLEKIEQHFNHFRRLTQIRDDR